MPLDPPIAPRLLADIGGTHPRFAWQAHAQAPLTDRSVYPCAESASLQQLHLRYGHVSAERALSGPGLVNLYDALCTLDDAAAEALAPADVTARAQSGTDVHCVQALDLFCRFLGDVAGNLALTLGARGGVYIGGGIVPRMVDTFRGSRFRERFEAKGRFAGYLAQMPTFVITSTASPAFIGAARALDAAQADATSRRRSGSTP